MRYHTVLAFLLLASCAAQTPAPAPVEPGVDLWAAGATRRSDRLRVIFDWTLQEGNARFSGEGVARLDAGYKARLDLFGPRGDTYLTAALVDFELRMPPGAPANLLPPPALLWSVLGVFRAPPGAQLIGATGDSAVARLTYAFGDERWTFELSGKQLQKAEWTGPAQGRQTVEIKERGERNLPSRVVYRDWRAFRELTLVLKQVNDAEPFDPEIWVPGGR